LRFKTAIFFLCVFLPLAFLTTCKNRTSSGLFSSDVESPDAYAKPNPELEGLGITFSEKPSDDTIAFIPGIDESGPLAAAQRRTGPNAEPVALDPAERETLIDQEQSYIKDAHNSFQGSQASNLASSPQSITMLTSIIERMLQAVHEIPGNSFEQKVAIMVAQEKPSTQSNIFNDIAGKVKSATHMTSKILRDKGNAKELTAMLLKLNKLIGESRDLKAASKEFKDPRKHQNFIELMRRFGGRDHFINLGDIARILPSIDAIGEEEFRSALLAKSQTGYNVYTRQANVFERIGFRLFGGRRELGAGLQERDYKVAQAVNATSELLFQSMRGIGTSSYFISDHSGSQYRDPDTNITSTEIRNLAAAFGMKVSGGSMSGNSSSGQLIEKAKEMGEQIRLVDGIPVEEALRILENPEVRSLPENLLFRFDNQARVVVSAEREPCICEDAKTKKTCQIKFKANANGLDATKYWAYDRPGETCTVELCNSLFTDKKHDGLDRKIDVGKACGNAYSFKDKLYFFERKEDSTLVAEPKRYQGEDCVCTQVNYSYTPQGFSSRPTWCIVQPFGTGFQEACSAAVCKRIYDDAFSKKCFMNTSLPWTGANYTKNPPVPSPTQPEVKPPSTVTPAPSTPTPAPPSSGCSCGPNLHGNDCIVYKGQNVIARTSNDGGNSCPRYCAPGGILYEYLSRPECK